MSKLDSALDRLDQAYNRLDGEQGRVARRNARQAFLKALREARSALDGEYPNIPKKRKAPRKRKHPRQLGWKTISTSVMADLVKLDVHPRHFRKAGEKFSDQQVYWTPGWIVDALKANVPLRTVARATKDAKHRRRLQTMVRLGKRQA